MIDGPGGGGLQLPQEDPYAPPRQRRLNMLQRRRMKIAAEVERNRRGEHNVPTWVLGAAVLLILAIWAAIIIFV